MRQIKILLEISDLLAKSSKITSNQIATRLNIHPYSAKKSLEQVKKYKYLELALIYRNLLNIDLQIKSSSTKPKLLLELLTAKF